MQFLKAELRRLTSQDAPLCAALTQQIGWSHNVEMWERLIRWGGDGGFCIAQGDKLLATAIAFAYGTRLAWVGVVITHPDYRGQGFGRQITAAAMDYLRELGVRCVMLDASDMGYRMYQRLGFRDLYKVVTWGMQTPLEGSHPTGREMQERDLAEVIALDAAVFGVERPEVIRELATPGVSWVDDASGQIDGYIMAQSSNHGWRIGPWYHRTPEGAERLFKTALAYPEMYPVRVQAPEPNLYLNAIIEPGGFQQVRSAIRMVWGDEPPGQMERQYGVAGLAMG